MLDGVFEIVAPFPEIVSCGVIGQTTCACQLLHLQNNLNAKTTILKKFIVQLIIALKS